MRRIIKTKELINCNFKNNINSKEPNQVHSNILLINSQKFAHYNYLHFVNDLFVQT